MSLNRAALNSIALNATVAGIVVAHAFASGGGGNHTCSGGRVGPAQASFVSSGGGNHKESHTTVRPNTRTVQVAQKSLNAFGLNAAPPSAPASTPIGVRSSGGGNHIASGTKLVAGATHTFVISDSTIVVASGYKIAANAARSSGGGNHTCSGVKLTLTPHEFRSSGGGSHTASGRQVYRWGISTGGGNHRAVGNKTVAASFVSSGGGNQVERGRKRETIPIDFNVHVFPLITFRVHVSPVGDRSMEDYLRPGSTNVVRITKMKNEITGLPITDATVTATLLDQDGNPVTDATDIAVPRAGAEYQGAMESTVVITPPGLYTVRVTATNADGVGQVDKPIPARRV